MLGGAIVYYAVVLPPITTIAHLCALVMGGVAVLCVLPKMSAKEEAIHSTIHVSA